MTAIEKRLDALESRIAMSELRAKYGWYVTRTMADEVAALFTHDGVFDTGSGRVLRGREQLRVHFTRAAPGTRVPQVTNEILHVDGDTGRGSCVMQSPNSPEGGGFCGHYFDDFKRIDGKWYFKTRRFYTYWPKFVPSPETDPLAPLKD